MSKKHYFELGPLLQAMRENDADRAIKRFRNLAGEHSDRSGVIDMAIFPAYMLALNWVAKRTDPRSPRHSLQYLDLATFEAAVNFNFFEDNRAREMLVDYVVENALRLNAVNSMEAHKRLCHLNDACKKKGYEGTTMQLKVEAAIKKTENDNNQDYFTKPGWEFRYAIARLSWLEGKWLDAILTREEGPTAYRSPSELEEIERRKLELPLDPMEMLDRAFADKADDPFRGNPRPSFEDVGIVYLSGAEKLCAEQDPEHVLKAASWVERKAEPNSLLMQSANALKRKTMARNAMTIESFMAGAEKLLAATNTIPNADSGRAQ